MPRTIPPGRFDALIRAATEEFIARGYRRTQMSDIAKAVGVSKATLYLYVESKTALFDLCLASADEGGEIPLPDALPVREGSLGWDPPAVEKRIEEAAAFPRLTHALQRPRAPRIGVELREVVAEFYDVMESHCRSIKLLDRCWDAPALGGAWHSSGRERPRQLLTDYMAQRMRAGQIRDDPEARVAARLLIETVATWAVHIKWDRAPESYEPASTRVAVIDFIARGLECR